MKYNLKPKNLILSVLRVAKQPAVSIKTLVAIGELFGFSGNTIRVATTRLISGGKIESDERGFYRFSAGADPVNRHFDTWRDGESRMVPWDGSWICCLPPKLPSGSSARNKKSLGFLGFKEGLTGLWIRPNNLRLDVSGVARLLERFGLENGTELYKAEAFREKLDEQWRRYLWPIEDLKASGVEILKKIEKSRLKLSSMPLENAVVESFLVGSEAVHRLNMDPLLPGEMLDASVRIGLTEAMLDYDKIGVHIWMEKFGDLRMGGAPSHLQLVKEG